MPFSPLKIAHLRLLLHHKRIRIRVTIKRIGVVFKLRRGEIRQIFIPHGALVIVECMSDNPTRTVANVKAIFAKNGGEILQNGALGFMFSHKSVFHLERFSGDLEELELDLIDFGLENLEQNDDELVVSGDYTAFKELSDGIAQKNLIIKKAGLEYVPNDPKKFSEEQILDIEKLLDKLEEDDDVQAVYTNID